MTLLSIFWKTVYWKSSLFLYVAISLFFWLNYDPFYHSIVILVVAQIAMTILAVMLIIEIWVGFPPALWIFSAAVSCVRILSEKYSFLMKMKHWCDENCNEKWYYCEHGYFIFREEADAVAFKLKWA